jgi:hypothetical protein
VHSERRAARRVRHRRPVGAAVVGAAAVRVPAEVVSLVLVVKAVREERVVAGLAAPGAPCSYS